MVRKGYSSVVPEPSNADLLAKLVQHDAALAAGDAELNHLAKLVNGHTDLLRDLQDALVSHGAELMEIRERLDSREATLESHTAKLDAHTAMLESHTAILTDHGRRLTSHGDILATILATVTRIEARLAQG